MLIVRILSHCIRQFSKQFGFETIFILKTAHLNHSSSVDGSGELLDLPPVTFVCEKEMVLLLSEMDKRTRGGKNEQQYRETSLWNLRTRT